MVYERLSRGMRNAARSGILGIAEVTLWLKVRDSAVPDGRVECWHLLVPMWEKKRKKKSRRG
jgi:hypothetical protein